MPQTTPFIPWQVRKARAIQQKIERDVAFRLSNLSETDEAELTSQYNFADSYKELKDG